MVWYLLLGVAAVCGLMSESETVQEVIIFLRQRARTKFIARSAR